MKNNKKASIFATKVRVSTDERRRELSKPTKAFTVNELVVSNLIRGLEMAMADKDAEKVITDSSLIEESVGKTLVFVGDVISFGEDDLDLGYLSVVGERIGKVVTPIRGSIANLVAERFTLPLDGVDFQSLSGKLLKGTTLMFSAKVAGLSEELPLRDIKVLDFGFRVLQEDGTTDSLAIFNDLVDTYNYEYYTVSSGVVEKNNYRNTSLDSYFEAYKTSNTQKPLEDALEYILGSYDEQYKKAKTKLWGIIKPD